jgi:hypothetical protein
MLNILLLAVVVAAVGWFQVEVALVGIDVQFLGSHLAGERRQNLLFL